jgi:hypothetical protein
MKSRENIPLNSRADKLIADNRLNVADEIQFRHLKG